MSSKDVADQWRALAKQFDRHRMEALWHLRALAHDPAHKNAVTKFLDSAPPKESHLSDNDVLRLARQSGMSMFSAFSGESLSFAREVENATNDRYNVLLTVCSSLVDKCNKNDTLNIEDLKPSLEVLADTLRDLQGPPR